MKGFIYIFSLLIFFLNSCSPATGNGVFDERDKVVPPTPPKVEYNVVKVEDMYSMKVPAFMTVTTEIESDARLQYVNLFKEKYVVVVDEEIDEIIDLMKDFGVYDESKSKLDNYVATTLHYFSESGSLIKNQTALKRETINGCKAISIVIDADEPSVDEDITHYFTYVEGKSHFYTISSWTLFERKAAFTDEVETMKKSFKEF